MLIKVTRKLALELDWPILLWTFIPSIFQKHWSWLKLPSGSITGRGSNELSLLKPLEKEVGKETGLWILEEGNKNE